METCRGKIYYSLKSRKDIKSCPNKAKDINGFCLRHKSQSQIYSRSKDYEASIGIQSIEFKVLYQGNTVTIKMRHHCPIGQSLKDVNEKFGCRQYIYMYNDNVVDLSLPAVIYDNKILELIPY